MKKQVKGLIVQTPNEVQTAHSDWQLESEKHRIRL